MDADHYRLLLAAEQAAEAALFGPVRGWLADRPASYELPSDDEDAQRFFRTAATPAVEIVVTETRAGHLEVETWLDPAHAERSATTAAGLRRLAAELLDAADLVDQTIARIAELE